MQIASDQKLEADALNTADQVRDRGGHVLGEEKLTSTLNVVPSATFRGPSARTNIVDISSPRKNAREAPP